MTDNIKLLEELVVEAVDRLRDVTRERDALREEVGSLRQRLDAQQRAAVQARGERSADGARRALEVLDEALAELSGHRGDGPVS